MLQFCGNYFHVQAHLTSPQTTDELNYDTSYQFLTDSVVWVTKNVIQ